MDEIKNDKRFSHILTNPKYFKMGRREHKSKVDSRFKEMFKSSNFKVNYTVDSRGRPWISSTNEDLKKFYDLSSSEESEKEKDSTNLKIKKKNIVNKYQQEINKNENKNKNEINLKTKDNIEKINYDKKILGSKISTTNKNNKKSKLLEIDPVNDKRFNNDENQTDVLIRHNTQQKSNKNLKNTEQIVNSVTHNDEYNYDDDDDDDDESDDNDDIDSNDDSNNLNLESDEGSSSDDEIQRTEISHAWGELDHDAPRTETISSRLALCNMDWDRIKVDDILVMLNSFKPDEGVINCVKIFLSDYGKERLEIEKLRGPPELTTSTDVKNDVSDEDDDDNADINNDEDSSKLNSEGSKYHQEKLRQYQLSRLKYYYAIIECDSMETADHIYKNCNGIEYEFSSNLIDLRFVPKDMVFENVPVSLSSSLPCHGTYKPTLYTNSALHQCNVELTWDETPADRVAVTMRDFSKVDYENMDIKDYLASASEEDDELVDGNSDGECITGTTKEVPMEEQIQKYKNLLKSLDEGSDKSDNDVDMEITWEPGLKETVEQKLEDKKTSELAPWEKYLDKKSKKKKLKKNKINNEVIDEESEKKTKGKEKKKGKKVTALTDQEKAELELLVMDGKTKIKTEDTINKKKEKSTDCDSALMPLLCVHG